MKTIEKLIFLWNLLYIYIQKNQQRQISAKPVALYRVTNRRTWVIVEGLSVSRTAQRAECFSQRTVICISQILLIYF